MALGYVAYKVYRKIRELKSLGNRPFFGPVGSEPEQLVQDPVCKVFIPRKEALKTTRNGEEYFFCSEGCLKRFRSSGKG
ncbi:MAG: YHS domain-containing protein [Thermodesulfobacteriota bacterium]